MPLSLSPCGGAYKDKATLPSLYPLSLYPLSMMFDPPATTACRTGTFRCHTAWRSTWGQPCTGASPARARTVDGCLCYCYIYMFMHVCMWTGAFYFGIVSSIRGRGSSPLWTGAWPGPTNDTCKGVQEGGTARRERVSTWGGVWWGGQDLRSIFTQPTASCTPPSAEYVHQYIV
jgi:hypothetical protein